MVRLSKKVGSIETVSLPCLTADDCSRHFELLNLFDLKSNDFKKTEYYGFNINNGKSHDTILKKIDKFCKLYRSIKKRGFTYKKGYIVISKDGARLDGSHRASIVEHLRFKELDVIVIKWEDLFERGELKPLYRHIEKQKEKYNA
tara:strand:- start:14497 stop:14931 length:435 start_codon:yes stop_codon:yes gene_type:complete